MRGNDDQIDRRPARALRLRQPVTTFVLGRTTTSMLALWSGYIAAWATVSGSSPTIVAAWWLAGVALLQAIAHHVVRQRARRTESSHSSEQADVGARSAPAGGAVQDLV
jgi:membrane protein implicated in regulation of membrane protease activity